MFDGLNMPLGNLSLLSRALGRSIPPEPHAPFAALRGRDGLEII